LFLFRLILKKVINCLGSALHHLTNFKKRHTAHTNPAKFGISHLHLTVTHVFKRRTVYKKPCLPSARCPLHVAIYALLFALCTMPLQAANAASVTLAWDKNAEADIAGYKLHYGSASRTYDHTQDVANSTAYTISDLDEGTTYYLAVTAYNSAGQESDFSEEVVHTIAFQNRQPNKPAVPAGPSGGYPNTGYDFSTSASDPDGDLLDYRFNWGDGVISSWGAASQSHSWSSTGAYCVKAQARDPNAANSLWSDCKDISIAVANQPPLANAGANQTVAEGDTVVLRGVNSSDPDGNLAGFSWNQTKGPTVTLKKVNLTDATFTAPEVSADGVALTFQLTAIDTQGLQGFDTCNVYVNNAAAQDSDNDGVPDDQDAFPSDPTETIDTDGDGIGNNADPDDDNDRMPDAWEIQYGLDPFVDDASEDADLDGISNLDEFLSDTDPVVPRGNSQPDPPALISPANQERVTLTPMLQTDDFYDPDPGDFHSETRWQITRQSDNVCVLDVISPNSLNSLQVPEAILKGNTRYGWKTRFYDGHGAPSDWSEPSIFVTGINPADSNGNGIPDDQEVDSTSDMDGNGILDVDQDTIKCVRTKGKKSQIGISFEGSDTVSAIEYFAYQDPGSVDSPSNKPNNFPFGLIDFRLLVNKPGDQAVVTVYFSDRAPKDGKWYKYEPIEGILLDYSANAEFGANRKSITLWLQDGGMGDGDGIANGIIIDPSGIAMDLSGSSSGSSGGGIDNIAGCFISATTHGPATDLQTGFLHKFSGPSLAIIFLLLFLIACDRSVLIRKFIEKKDGNGYKGWV
jgi:hypothetical protein